MHGNINTRDRYATCPTCGKQASRDTILGWCVNTGCEDYFGTRTERAIDAREQAQYWAEVRRDILGG